MRKHKMFQCPYNEAVSCKMDIGCFGCEDFKGEEIESDNPSTVKQSVPRCVSCGYEITQHN